MAWTAERVLLTLAMWWVMMVAMMVPAAAPVVLLYAKAAPQAHSGAFLAGYLLCWLGFSTLALALHIALETAGHMMPMAMTLSSRWLAGGVLIAAGLYQFTPLKSACLSHCRNPAHWLSRHLPARRVRRAPNGPVARRVLRRLLLDADAAAVRRRRDESGVGRGAHAAGRGGEIAPRGEWIARVGGLALILWGVATLALG